MRAILTGVLLLLAWITHASAHHRALTHSNNLLVLIQPAFAGPLVDPNSYWNPQWILWPPTFDQSKGGRLLTLASGTNWVGDSSYFGPASYFELKRHGYFSARFRRLGNIRTDLLLNSRGGASSNALLLSVNSDSPVVKPYWIEEAWPTKSIMVAEASNWDDVRLLESATSGRVLVVEYPPRANEPWTRFWLRGHQWPIIPAVLVSRPSYKSAKDSTQIDTNTQLIVPRPVDSTIPGLIPASLLMRLVAYPGEFQWERVDVRSWPGANKFLVLNHTAGPWVAFGWMLFASLGAIWGAVLVANEQTSRVLPKVLTVGLLSPAVLDLAGLLSRYLGISSWPIWLLLSALLALVATHGLAAWQRRLLPKGHPLTAVCLVGFLVLFLVNPVWSFMSPVFGGRNRPVSPIGVAALFGYLTGFVACVQGCGQGWKWTGRLACILFPVAGFAYKTWWWGDPGGAAMISLASWLIGERLFRWPMISFAILWPTSLVPLVARGFVWSPGGLLLDARDMGGLNVYEYFEFLTCGSLLPFLLVAGGISLFGFRFFFHQVKSLRQLDLRRNALPTAAVVAFGFGIFHPIFLYAGLTLATGAAFALLFDAVQTM